MGRAVNVDSWCYDVIVREQRKLEDSQKRKGLLQKRVSMTEALRSLLKRLEQYEASNDEKTVSQEVF